MSKKLIAVAAAAALALTGLVAVPASASSLTVSAGTVGSADGPLAGDGLASTTAWTIPVPSQDVLRATNTVTTRSVVTLVVTSIEANAALNVTATGGVKLLNATQLAAATTTTATGTSTLSLSANDSKSATFYAYNTSTSAGSVVVNEVKAGAVIGANTRWIKGVTYGGNAYKVSLTAPSIAGASAKVEYTATVVDMFGNAVESLTDLKHTTLGGDAAAAAPATNMSWNSTKKVYEGSFTNRTTAGPVALLVALTASADSVTAFGAKTASVFASINAADLQATVTALQAEVAALKADYNKLATKWNKRLALKKAPKKAATLK
jgi:hypothetical protein